MLLELAGAVRVRRKKDVHPGACLNTYMPPLPPPLSHTPAGVHGPTPEALAAYTAVRLPLSGAVQAASVQVSGAQQVPTCSVVTARGGRASQSAASLRCLACCRNRWRWQFGHCTRWQLTRCSWSPLQLCKDFKAGNMGKESEYDVNIRNGFVQRTFQPLQPAAAGSV